MAVNWPAPRPADCLFGGRGEPRRAGEGRHDLAGEAADVGDRTAEIDDDVFDAGRLQRLELAGDLVGRPEACSLVAMVADRRSVVADKALALVARPLGQLVDPQMPLEAPHIGSLQFLGRV